MRVSVGKVTECWSHPVFWCGARCSFPTNQPGCSWSFFPMMQILHSAANLPSPSELICALTRISPNYCLALLLTSDYFLTKLKSAKFAMTGMHLMLAGAGGKCVFADKTPHSSHLTQQHPYSEPGPGPGKNRGGKGQALGAGDQST